MMAGLAIVILRCQPGITIAFRIDDPSDRLRIEVSEKLAVSHHVADRERNTDKLTRAVAQTGITCQFRIDTSVDVSE